MNYNTAIIAFIASASATKIKSQADAEFVYSIDWSAVGDGIVDGFVDLGEGIVDLGETIGEGIVDLGQDIGEGLSEAAVDVGEHLLTFGDNLLDSGEALGSYIISGDGLTYDVQYIFSKDFG